jgi:hypothetical protein
MAKKNDDDIVKEVVKKPRGGKYSPVIGDNGLQVEAGDNAKFLRVSLELANLPDVDMKDPEQVRERINQYFNIYALNDMKPTVAGLGLALNGMDRRRLWEIRTDVPNRNQDLPTLTRDLIKKAYKIMENQWENYMQNGKINPVSGIFLGKNNFGYQDKTEYVVTPNVNNDADYNKEDIQARYAIDSPTLPTIDSPDSSNS